MEVDCGKSVGWLSGQFHGCINIDALRTYFKTGSLLPLFDQAQSGDW
jgi:hypothetical protein